MSAGAVHLERLRLPPRPVEGEHQLSAKVLPQRVLANERLELGHELRVAPQCEVSVDALLESGQPLLAEPGASGVCERHVELRQGSPAPKPERLLEQDGRLLRRRTARLGHQPLEASEVELAVAHADQVARRLRDDHVAS